MDTIDTIITNARILANSNIDWSLDGGMLWLTSFMVLGVTMLVMGTART